MSNEFVSINARYPNISQSVAEFGFVNARPSVRKYPRSGIHVVAAAYNMPPPAEDVFTIVNLQFGSLFIFKTKKKKRFEKGTSEIDLPSIITEFVDLGAQFIVGTGKLFETTVNSSVLIGIFNVTRTRRV